MEENVLDFNFWPSFADLMLVLVLILVIVFVVGAVISAMPPDSNGTVPLAHVEERQEAMIDKIANVYGVEPEPKKDHFKIPIMLEDGGRTAISIQNEPTLQRFSFRDRILFEPDEYELKDDGQKTLQIVGRQIKSYLDLGFIREIQIQGHADPGPLVAIPV